MSAICYMCRLTTVLLSLLAVVLITGGVEAQERYIYELVIENNVSKVTTGIQVFAESEREARENVAANGWRIISMRQISYDTVDLVTIKKGDAEPQQIAVVDAPGSGSLVDPDNLTADNLTTDNLASPEPALTDDELIAAVMGANAPSLPQVYIAYYPNDTKPAINEPMGTASASTPDMLSGTGEPLNGREPGTTAYIGQLNGADAPLRGDNDMLGNIPDADSLLFRYAVFFDFGKIDPLLSEKDSDTLKSMPIDGKYYLFGHTDNVRVRLNPYYTDNFDLSFKRAEGIKSRLGEYGIEPANISTVGLGALYPAVENRPGIVGTPQNRRVEIYEYKTE